MLNIETENINIKLVRDKVQKKDSDKVHKHLKLTTLESYENLYAECHRLPRIFL